MDERQKQELLETYMQQIAPERDLESLTADRGVVERIATADGTDDEKAEAEEGLKRLHRHEQLSDSQLSALEAIVLPRERPVVDIVNDSYEAPDAPFSHYDAEEVRRYIEAAVPAVGRIELPDHPRVPYGGTGFVVGDGILMTNRHVAELFAAGLGRDGLLFHPGQTAAIDFKQEIHSDETSLFQISDILMIHPYWDMALSVGS